MIHIGLLYSILCTCSSLLLYYAFLVYDHYSLFYLTAANRNVSCPTSIIQLEL